MSWQMKTWHLPADKETGRMSHMNPNDATNYFYKPESQLRSYYRVPEGQSHILPVAPTKPKIPKIRISPTYDSAIFTARDQPNYTQYNPKMQEYLEPKTCKTARETPNHNMPKNPECYNQRVSMRRLSCLPYGTIDNGNLINSGPEVADKSDYKVGITGATFKKSGYKNFIPLNRQKIGDSKIREPGAYYGPTRKHLPHDVKQERPGDHIVAQKAKGVDEQKGNELKRTLAGCGHQLVDVKFRQNPITNVRTGEGTLHVRAKTAIELKAIQARIKETGMEVDTCSRYEPVWNKY